MNQQQLTFAKFAAVLVVLVGGFVLVGMGKLDAPTMYQQTTMMVGALVVALGISGAGVAAGSAISSASNAKLAAMRSPDEVRRGQAGFVRAGVLLFLSPIAGVVGVVVLFFCLRCGAGGLSQQGATDVTIGVQAAGCVIVNVATDLAAGESPPQIVLDVIAKCGVTAAQAGTLLDQQSAAEAKIGHADVGAKFSAVAAAAHVLAQDAGP